MTRLDDFAKSSLTDESYSEYCALRDSMISSNEEYFEEILVEFIRDNSL